MTETRVISFPNGRMARSAEMADGDDVRDAPHALGLQRPNAVLHVAGDLQALDATGRSRLVQLFSRGLARAARTTGALIVDDGAAHGVAALVGQAVADRGSHNVVLGVGPAAATTSALDQNHTHFVLCRSHAGDRGLAAQEIADALSEAGPAEHDTVPVVLLVVGGGPDTQRVILRAVRRGHPVLVIAGTGGVADAVADAVAAVAGADPGFVEDPELAEIAYDGEVHVRSIADDVKEFEHQLTGLCEEGSDDLLLRHAWGQLGRYDKAAGDYQRRFRRQQNRILALGVVAVLLVVLQAQYWGNDPPGTGGIEEDVWNVLHFLIVLAPIVTAILVGLANRMNPGLKQILLRAAAESVKREIYRYRARSAEYSDRATRAAGISRSTVLASRLKGVNETLMSTQANESALPPYEGPIPPKYAAAEDDDGLSMLTATRYIKLRLADQRSFYESKSRRLEASRYRLHAAILVVGGAGTLLAAMNYELWVTLTTALAAACAAYMEYQQVEATLVSYNQAKSNLYDVEAWWLGLSSSQRGDPARFSDLVEATEKVLGTEQVAWVQNMQDALAELRRDPTGQGPSAAEKTTSAEPPPAEAPPPPAEAPPATTASPDEAAPGATPPTAAEDPDAPPGAPSG